MERPQLWHEQAPLYIQVAFQCSWLQLMQAVKHSVPSQHSIVSKSVSAFLTPHGRQTVKYKTTRKR